MKVAYIGYDLSCTKASGYFQKHMCEVTFFLQKKKQNFNYKSFAELDIFADHLMISGDLKLRTVTHQQFYKVLENDYLELKKNLNPFRFVHDDVNVSKTTNLKPDQVFDLESLKDLQYDGKQKKIFIELEKKGVEAFDYVFIEAHPYIADILAEKKINAFRRHLENEYSWVSATFEIDFLKPVEPFFQQKMFFVVQDPLRKSIVDNWFFCHFETGHLNVWGYLPFLQVANPEFKNFYIDRVRRFISEKFKFLYVKNFIKSELCTVGAYNTLAPMSLLQTQSAPNFMYWSVGQVTEHFELNFTKKIKNFNLLAEGVHRD